MFHSEIRGKVAGNPAYDTVAASTPPESMSDFELLIVAILVVTFLKVWL